MLTFCTRIHYFPRVQYRDSREVLERQGYLTSMLCPTDKLNSDYEDREWIDVLGVMVVGLRWTGCRNEQSCWPGPGLRLRLYSNSYPLWTWRSGNDVVVCASWGMKSVSWLLHDSSKASSTKAGCAMRAVFSTCHHQLTANVSKSLSTSAGDISRTWSSSRHSDALRGTPRQRTDCVSVIRLGITW